MTTHPRPAGPSISAAALDLFQKVSTATLTTQMFKRGFRNVYVGRATRLTITATGNLVGPAFTMRYIPVREDLDHLGVFADPEHPQRKGVETVPPEQEQLEAFVLERIRNGAALPRTYPPSDSTRAAYEEWRRKQ